MLLPVATETNAAAVPDDMDDQGFKDLMAWAS